MKRIIPLFLVIMLIAFSQSATAETIRIAIGSGIPPYVFVGEERGIEVDLVRAAFAAVDQSVEIRYLPNRRLPISYRDGMVDGVVVNKVYDLAGISGKPVYLSNTTISFQNNAITLPDGPNILKLQDLAKHSVVSFTNATKYLGEAYRSVVLQNSHYTEISDQAVQVELLLAKRFDVAVSDKRIFLYWKRELEQSTIGLDPNVDRTMVFHDVFEPAPRCVHFARPEYRDLFNGGLAIIQADGTLERIMESYIGK